MCSHYKGVLPNHIYLQALGTLVDSVFAAMIDKLEEIDDLSEEETHRLHALFSIMYRCETFFHSAPHTKKAQEGKRERRGRGGEGLDSESEEKHWWVRMCVPHWTKFVKLTNILEEKLVVIVDNYLQQKLREFSSEEIRHLITALFSDSPLRREKLALILK